LSGEASPCGQSLNRFAFSATVHCLTACAIGEVIGMVIGNAAGFPAGATVALSIGLAFVFGNSFSHHAH
jgi:TctA family transporter